MDEHNFPSNKSVIDTYMEERVNPQIEWYDNKSQQSKRHNRFWSYTVILLSTMIPIIIIVNNTNPVVTFIVALLGAFISIAESLNNFNKHGENWIEYRTVCETLKHEKNMFTYKSGVYSEGDLSFFVERIESIISQENVNWASLNHPEKKGGK